MHRIDAPGATIDNLFTEGNPSLGVPATEVSDDWLNDMQEEIANFIENQGIVLVKGDQDQLELALGVFLQNGGGLQAAMALDDNQVAAVDVTAIAVLDKAVVKSAKIMVDVFRRDDGQHANKLWELIALYDPEDDDWTLTWTANGEDDGMAFSILASGQIQYKSSSFGGANYAGTLRAVDKRIVPITLTP